MLQILGSTGQGHGGIKYADNGTLRADAYSRLLDVSRRFQNFQIATVTQHFLRIVKTIDGSRESSVFVAAYELTLLACTNVVQLS